MQHFCPILASKPLIPFRPLCIFSLCSLTTTSCSCCSFTPPAFSWFSILPISSLLLLSDSQSFLNTSHYLVYSSFWNLIPLFSPRQAGFRPGRSTLDQILLLSQSISDGFNKPRSGSRTILFSIDFSKAFDSVWHSPFSINSFRLASLFALLVGLNLFFLTGALVWSFKITKVVPFESVEVFRKDPFLVLSFFSVHQWSPCFSAFFRQLLSLCWQSGHLVLLLSP